MLYKKGEEGKTWLITAVLVDDVLISKNKNDVKEFREIFKKAKKIRD